MRFLGIRFCVGFADEFYFCCTRWVQEHLFLTGKRDTLKNKQGGDVLWFGAGGQNGVGEI